MSEFIITTTDSAYTYTSTIPVGIAFTLNNNNKVSSTQGYLVKIQKGQNRVQATVRLKVSTANYRTVFEPMLIYPSNVDVTFDRNIPGKSSTQMECVLSSMKIVQEFTGDEIEIEITLIEVLTT